jgi:CRISPR system Cascade subunit CasC
MTTYLTIHHIVSMPLGLANRGADGLAKTGVYGGVVRQRISSQCVKAHLREHPALISIAETVGQQASVRSALIGERRISPALVADGATKQEADALSIALMAALFQKEKRDSAQSNDSRRGRKKKDGDEPAADTDEAPADDQTKPGRQIIVLGNAEIEAMICIAKAVRVAGIKAEKLAEAIKKPAGNIRDTLDTLRALRHHSGLDGALFGRMATSSVVSSVDGAVSVGHWLTAHRIQSTTDFFSAQDQLLTDDEMGTAHIGTAELASGVFYGSTLIDLSRLQLNLGLDLTNTRAVLAAVLEAVVSTDPSAKRGSTGAACETHEVAIEIGEAMGLSAMNTFETPCDAVSEMASEKLRQHLKSRQARLTARQRPRNVFILSEIVAEGGTMDELIVRATDAAIPAAIANAAE